MDSTISPSARQTSSTIDRIDRRLAELIPSSARPLFAAARYALLSSGKRVRPQLTIAVAEGLGGDPDLALDPACAIEMIHAYSLIHDDLPCMDDDDLRRGIPTLHKVFSEGMALLTGDYLLTYAFEVLVNAPGLASCQKLRLAQILSRAAGGEGMVGGQAIDIESQGKSIDEKELDAMHRGKTGSLIGASLLFGAVAANAEEGLSTLLETIGSEIGLAFQFIDDFLDATATRELTGKNGKRDAALKKATAVSLFGLEGVKRRIEEKRRSIEAKLQRLPSNGSLIAWLLQQYLWNRFLKQSVN